MKKIAEFLSKLVVDASRLITEEFWVKAKDDKGDLVTNFDLAIEKFIIDKLNTSYPDYKIVSEEFNSENTWSEKFFTIDPIDGTINFANRLPLWGIQVACVENGKTVASVIYLPKLNELYVADDEKAYLNGNILDIKSYEYKSNLYSIESKGTLATKCILEMIEEYPHQRKFFSMAVEYAFVASGRLGGVCFLCDNLWDYLPGCHLVEMAGGVVKHERNNHIAANTVELLDAIYTYTNNKK